VADGTLVGAATAPLGDGDDCAPVPAAIPAVELSCVGISDSVGTAPEVEGAATPDDVGPDVAVAPVGIRMPNGVWSASAPLGRPGGVNIIPVGAEASSGMTIGRPARQRCNVAWNSCAL
jgi:hypothetical protein